MIVRKEKKRERKPKTPSFKVKAFTLIELLVVIMIIGVLASTMMLSSGASTTTAQATAIISDLRNLKAAAIMHYMDHMEEYKQPASGTVKKPTLSDLVPYMDNPKKLVGSGTPPTGQSDTDAYQIRTVEGLHHKWFVGVRVADYGVQEKLEAKAEEVGLFAGVQENPATYAKSAGKTVNNVYMMVK